MLASILIFFSSQNCATRGFGEGGVFVPQLVVFRHRWLFFFLNSFLLSGAAPAGGGWGGTVVRLCGL